MSQAGAGQTIPKSFQVIGGSDGTNARVLTVTSAGSLSTASPAATSGGASPFHLMSAATTNATSVKASAGQVYSVQAVNVNAAVRYLKLYDKATAPTVGTDVPVFVIALPPSAPVSVGVPPGLAFANGVALALTTGIADADTGAVALNEITVNLAYK